MIKWLRRLRVAAEPTYSREETSKYTDLMPDGSAREFTFYGSEIHHHARPSGGQR
jgi:sulfane dehydrogenase subunit SoxC